MEAGGDAEWEWESQLETCTCHEGGGRLSPPLPLSYPFFLAKSPIFSHCGEQTVC